MRSFVHDGIEYRSMREWCRKFGQSWEKLRRLCRHYQRAYKDPAVACDWLLGRELLRPSEQRTFKYEQDKAHARARQEAWRERQEAAIQGVAHRIAGT